MGIRIDGTSDLINATDGSLTIEGQSINTTGIVTAASLVTADKIIHNGDTNTAIRFPAADTFSVETAGSERVRILSTGRVAIGTDSASSILHLKDGDNTIAHFGNHTYDDGVIQYYNGSFNIKTGSSNGDRLITLQTAGSERLRIDSAGKVGIATASPVTTLDVRGDVAVDYNATHALRFYTQPRNNWSSISNTATDGNANLSFKVSQGEAINIGYSKLVGIGTDNPQVKLTVSSDSPAVCDIHHNDGGTNDEARIMLGALHANPPSNRGAGIAAVNNGAGHDLIIKCSASHSAGPTENVRVTSAGIVGINTVTFTTGSKLEVSSEGAYGIISRSQNGNGGYHVFTGQSSGGTNTSYITHNGRGYFEDGVQFDSSGEVLDSYEEGTWTPVPENTTNTPTYHNQSGIYTKIGNLVTVVGFLQFNVAPTFSSDTSELRVTGLPFTSNGIGYEGTVGSVSFQSLNWSGSTYNDYGAEGHMTCGVVENTKNVFKVNPAGNNLIRGTLRRKAFEGGGIITWEMTYKTNS